LAAPCVAAISATSREIGGAKWTLRAVLFQTGAAYLVACIIFQVGHLVFGG
jgi:Fe2+ transport system protein B